MRHIQNKRNLKSIEEGLSAQIMIHCLGEWHSIGELCELIYGNKKVSRNNILKATKMLQKEEIINHSNFHNSKAIESFMFPGFDKEIIEFLFPNIPKKFIDKVIEISNSRILIDGNFTNLFYSEENSLQKFISKKVLDWIKSELIKKSEELDFELYELRIYFDEYLNSPLKLNELKKLKESGEIRISFKTKNTL